jgi:hypothetical protein
VGNGTYTLETAAHLADAVSLVNHHPVQAVLLLQLVQRAHQHIAARHLFRCDV